MPMPLINLQAPHSAALGECDECRLGAHAADRKILTNHVNGVSRILVAESTRCRLAGHRDWKMLAKAEMRRQSRAEVGA